MNEEFIKHQLREELSEIEFSEAQKKTIVDHLSCNKTRTKRFKPAIAIGLCSLLLASSAFAWMFYPTLATWFQNRNVGVTISPDFFVQATTTVPLDQTTLNDIQIIIWEAYADNHSFMVNVEFKPQSESAITLVPYSGLLSELPQETQSTSLRFVSAESWRGSVCNELYTCREGENGTLWIINEGWSDNSDAQTLQCRLSVASYDEGKRRLEQIEIDVAPRTAGTLDECSLVNPLIFSKSHLQLCSLEFVRTELRVYYSYEGSGEHQPLSYAVRDLDIVIADEDGKRIPDVLPYNTPIPDVLVVQVIDNNSGEIIESRELIRRGNEYI